jgi:large subunit ribosomal protein L32
MAVPKRKTGRIRTNSRRSSHTLTPAGFQECPQCHEPKMPHRVCPNCGMYAARQVLAVEK